MDFPESNETNDETNDKPNEIRRFSDRLFIVIMQKKVFTKRRCNAICSHRFIASFHHSLSSYRSNSIRGFLNEQQLENNSVTIRQQFSNKAIEITR